MSLFANPPNKLKSISYFFKLAEDHEQKYVAVSYWCSFHALKRSLKINAKEEDAETTIFIKKILKWLEDVKKNNPENLAITDDKEAAKLILDFITKYFTYAEKKENCEILDKTVSKAYYNAALLIDVMEEFGDIDEQLLEQQKFAKYKTALIHKNLSMNQTANSENNDSLSNGGDNKLPKSILKPSSFSSFSSSSPQPQSQSTDLKSPSQTNQSDKLTENEPESKNQEISPELIKDAKRYCRYAESAMNFDDFDTAVENLEKALKIMKTYTNCSNENESLI